MGDRQEYHETLEKSRHLEVLAADRFNDRKRASY
jgi:hypothetical protein